MLFSPIAWALFVITLLVALPGALASPSPKRSKKQSSTRVRVETYPAIEGDEETLEISVPRSLSVATPPPSRPAAPKVAATRKSMKATANPTTLGTSVPASMPLGRKNPISTFEFVPAEKREQVLKRMQLCQSLFIETGRAYDYRSMTTRELETELVTVRQAKAVAVRRNDPNTLFKPVENPIEEKDPILNPDLSLEVE
jgi:hypothetical protein